jgi:hypothetical protein
VSPRTRKALPTIEPIVPVTGSPLLHDPQWIYEPKFDGYRGVISGRECYIRSKRGKVLSRFADLALRVGAELHARDAILDGEVVALDDEGRMDFRALLASRGWLHYAAFDVLWLNGKDLRAQPPKRTARPSQPRRRGDPVSTPWCLARAPDGPESPRRRRPGAGWRSPREDAGCSFGGPAVVGPSWRRRVRPERRRGGGETRGFAAPVFAGCALVDGW